MHMHIAMVYSTHTWPICTPHAHAHSDGIQHIHMVYIHGLYTWCGGGIWWRYMVAVYGGIRAQHMHVTQVHSTYTQHTRMVYWYGIYKRL